MKIITKDGLLKTLVSVLAHAASHLSGGSDPVKLDDLAAPDDNTDLNASAAKHGLCPKFPIPQEAWIAPTLLNSWVNYGGTREIAGYMKDNLGFVHLKGCIKNGTIGQIAFVLPAGYRPNLYQAFNVPSNSAFGQVDINHADGNVYATIGSNVLFDLNGITFRAEN